MIKYLTSNNYIVSNWSGGTTTQISIFPNDSIYAEQNFLWRISSATIDDDISHFTTLNDYNRYIASLNNTIELSHTDEETNKPYNKLLSPFEFHYFDGGVSTTSMGKCTDFNIMLRKDKCIGNALSLRGQISHSVNNILHIPYNCLIIYAINESLDIKINNTLYTINPSETLIIDNSDKLTDILCKSSAIYFIITIKYI